MSIFFIFDIAAITRWPSPGRIAEQLRHTECVTRGLARPFAPKAGRKLGLAIRPST
jgi:hypothetical protein